ncbi:MAG: DNA cytosine methyltransferase [Archaeoglobaceae archaeon]
MLVDLFAGAGGFSRGFVEEGFEVVAAVENFKPVAETYRLNFDAEVIEKDVKLVTGRDIERICGDVEVLIGSPPCEPFTAANATRFAKASDRLYVDKRGQLTLHFVRLVKELKPKVFVMENVPGILDVREALIREFRKAGYDVHFNVLRAEDYGNPSKRKRVFISNFKISPEPSKKNPRVIDAIGDLVELSDDVPNHRAEKLTRDVRNLKWGESLVSFEGARGRYRNYVRLHPYRPAPPVMGHSRFVHPFVDRLLSVREHARLMGFPDDHVFAGGLRVQYSMVGEAVPVPLARAVAREVKRILRTL